MRKRVVGLFLAVISVAGATRLNAQQAPQAVRPEGSGVQRLIAGGFERSATFRALVTTLDNADVVVYVRFARCAGDVPACLLWVTAGSGPRRLVVRLDRFVRSEDELTALLAHELQHANEVALNPGVKDLTSFRKLFESRGWKGQSGFETRAAGDIGRHVKAELLAER